MIFSVNRFRVLSLDLVGSWAIFKCHGVNSVINSNAETSHKRYQGVAIAEVQVCQNTWILLQ